MNDHYLRVRLDHLLVVDEARRSRSERKATPCQSYLFACIMLFSLGGAPGLTRITAQELPGESGRAAMSRPPPSPRPQPFLVIHQDFEHCFDGCYGPALCMERLTTKQEG
jgi:hypothetical protein